MQLRAEIPHLGLGLAADGGDAAIAGARFVEIAVDAALPDFEEADSPSVNELPCVAHAGALGPLSPAEIAHLARTVAARGAHWLSIEPVGVAAGCAVAPPPIALDRAGVAEVESRAAALAGVPLVLSSSAVLDGEMHCADFWSAIVARTGCAFRLDLDHLIAFQSARGLADDHRVDALPLDRIVAIAIGESARTHHLLSTIVPRCPALRGVMLRGDPERLAELARLLAGAGFPP